MSADELIDYVKKQKAENKPCVILFDNRKHDKCELFERALQALDPKVRIDFDTYPPDLRSLYAIYVDLNYHLAEIAVNAGILKRMVEEDFGRWKDWSHYSQIPIIRMIKNFSKNYLEEHKKPLWIVLENIDAELENLRNPIASIVFELSQYNGKSSLIMTCHPQAWQEFSRGIFGKIQSRLKGSERLL